MAAESQRKKLAEINPPVFLISAGLILVVTVLSAVFAEEAEPVFKRLLGGVADTVGWFYMLAVAIFLVFVVGLAFSRYGRVKLGPDDAEPEYSYVSWFAMLFSAGMGIGLIFFGVAEPVMHFTNPPIGEGGTVEAARNAMTLTFFHWGFHAWGIYAVVGLSLAYFSFRHGLPLTIRSALYPILGERIHGPAGHAIDIFAVLGTLFGVATSLGLGVMQVNSGLAHLFDLPQSATVQIGLIAAITLCATVSVVSGLDAGVKRLSELNLVLALALLVFMLVAGPTLFLLTALVQNVGTYLSEAVSMTFHAYAYEPTDWFGGWTLFYWGWWIAWSPFVGMFIARVSKGRTIREFVGGVLLVPAGFTFLWFTFFGDTALSMELAETGGAISKIVQENLPVALFSVLEQLPGNAISSLLATLLVITFFVTSSDSGSLVIDMITSGGNPEPPVWQRVFWAVFEGVVAAALLLAGGLTALQTASIASALPFAVAMLFICWGLLKGLRMEHAVHLRAATAPPVHVHGAATGWKQRLRNIIRHHPREDVLTFLRETAAPAMEAVAEEIRATGLDVEVRHEEGEASLTVAHPGEAPDFLYAVKMREYGRPAFALNEAPPGKEMPGKHYRAEVYLLEGPEHYDVMGFSKEQVIGDLLAQYDKHVHFLHLGTQGAVRV